MSNFLLNTDQNLQKQYIEIQRTITLASGAFDQVTTIPHPVGSMPDVRCWVISPGLYSGARMLTTNILMDANSSALEGVVGSVGADENNVYLVLSNQSGSSVTSNFKIRVYYND